MFEHRRGGTTYANEAHAFAEHVHKVHRLAGEVARHHHNALSDVAYSHQHAFAVARQTPDMVDTREQLRRTTNETGRRLQHTTSRVDTLVGSLANAAESQLPIGDRRLMASLSHDIMDPTRSNFFRKVHTAKTGSAHRQGVDAVLDNLIWNRLHNPQLPLDRETTRRLLSLVSHPTMRQAMQAGLDSQIFNKLSRSFAGDKNVLEKPKGEGFVRFWLRQSSGHGAEKAMQAGLDGALFHHLQAYNRRRPQGAEAMITKLLAHTSGSTVRQVFERDALGRSGFAYEEPFIRTAGKAGFSMGDFLRGAFGRARRNKSKTPPKSEGPSAPQYDDWPEPETDYGTQNKQYAFEDEEAESASEREWREYHEEKAREKQREQHWQDRSRHSNDRTQERRYYEAPPLPDAELIETIIKSTLEQRPDRKWLLSTDRSAIQDVITAVRTLRQEKPDISDLQIYARFRKATDKAEQGDDTTVDPHLKQAFDIVDAMMGGPKGQIPIPRKPAPEDTPKA